ncbi:hypothetical protein [Actinopolymorpha rutila]|uniref:Uncharacterized protein n=1 Tax=Actinopolymorpha rutila TaxID=446787 RepID=A0A852Z7Y0_9ACTN|nr:hypothetical protein [Actinopolymorpha rutila]NYH89367.1 hypothetical protein [Actinopolymorpha rutila]
MAALVLISGAAAWILAGHSQESKPVASRSAASPAAAAELSERLPISGLLYTWTGSDERIARAQQHLITACMKKQGFDYESAPIPKAADVADARPTPFGLESLDPPGPDSDQTLPPEPHESAAYVHALFGDPGKRISATGKFLKVTRPATGCQADAEKRLLGDGRLRWLQLRLQVGDGEKESRQRLEKDAAFRAANQRWQQCMRQAGIKVNDPLQLLQGLPADTDVRTNPATRADVHCKADTGYLATAYTRLAAAQRAWLARSPRVLTDWKTLARRQDAAARTVLGKA